MNHDEIRAALAAATPGPWDAKPLGSEGYAVTGAPDPDAPAARDWRAEANQLTDADALRDLYRQAPADSEARTYIAARANALAAEGE